MIDAARSPRALPLRLPLLPILALLMWFSLVSASFADSPTSSLPSSTTAEPALVLENDESIDLIFEEPTSATDIYRAASKALGLNVLFDPKLKDREISLVLERVQASTIFDRITSAAGHFYKVLDENSLIIADDTPQNRRTYDNQHIQTFYLEHAKLPDLMTLLRSTIGVKHLATNSDLNSVTVRDTASRTRLAEALIQAYDKPAEIVEVEVEILEIEAGALGQLKQTADGKALPLRIHHDALQRFRVSSAAHSVTRTQLSSVAGKEVELNLGHRVPFPMNGSNAAAAQTGEVSYQEVGLRLRLTPRAHASSGEITLRVDLEISYLDDLAVAGGSRRPVSTYRELTSEIRLARDETVLLRGLWSVDACSSQPSGDTLALLAPQSCDTSQRHPRHLIIALTPRTAQPSAITARDRLPLAIGTEALIADPRPVEENKIDQAESREVRARLRQKFEELERTDN